MKNIEIYTDGACQNNPGGRGAYCAILRYNGVEKIIKGAYRSTTNNRMEIMGVIKALEVLNQPCIINLYSDSQYVLDIIKHKHYENPKTVTYKKRKNWDLWMKIKILREKHTINTIWIRGHDGHIFNEMCDMYAGEEMRNGVLGVDSGYENPTTPKQSKIF